MEKALHQNGSKPEATLVMELKVDMPQDVFFFLPTNRTKVVDDAILMLCLSYRLTKTSTNGSVYDSRISNETV
jgi:hypothetical protein